VHWEFYGLQHNHKLVAPPSASAITLFRTTMNIANTPPPPYYAVIFSSFRTPTCVENTPTSTKNDDDGAAPAASIHEDDDTLTYEDAARRMIELAARQPGFLGVESARHGLGITISYWMSLEAIANWRHNSEHSLAQHLGRKQWYQSYKTRICKVERDYGFDAVSPPSSPSSLSSCTEH
jgi:heme-degrading monooxygenase HmoA